jgi:hypothetical protein
MGGHNIVEAARATQEWRHSYAEPFLAPQTCQTSPWISCKEPDKSLVLLL